MTTRLAVAILNIVILKPVSLLITNTHFLSRTAHSSFKFVMKLTIIQI
jgi:hypothetical protein